MDDVDLRILALLQEDARMSNAEIARRVNMAASAVYERIRKLEDRGVLRGYAARLNPRAFGLGLLAYVFVKAGERVGDQSVGRALGAIPGVEEVHGIAGEDCYLVKVRAADPEDLGRLLRERFGSIEGVTSTKTTIVLTTLREHGGLPLDGRVAEAARARR